MKFDDKLWCEECDQSLEKECTIHGFYSIIRDKTIPTRAKLTTPYQLTVKRLELRAGNNHVYGTFAKKIIQKRTRFGPFEGPLTEQWKHQREDRLSLKLFTGQNQWLYIDCTDEDRCNWMMFVRPADQPEQQNMVAFQYQGKIYFVSTKTVSIEEELRIWYAKDYAKEMGVNLLIKAESPPPLSPPSPFTQSNLHIDEEFLTPPGKNNKKKVTPEKAKKINLTVKGEAVKKDQHSNNLQTLASIALQPSFSASKTESTNLPLISTQVPADTLPSLQLITPAVQHPIQVSTPMVQSMVSLPQTAVSIAQGFGPVGAPIVNAWAPFAQDNLSPSLTNVVVTQSPVPAGYLPMYGDNVPKNSSMSQGTVQLVTNNLSEVTNNLPTYQSAAIQGAKIDNDGILTIQESDLDSTTTLNVEILRQEVSNSQKEGGIQGDPLDSENPVLTIDESRTILLAMESDLGEENEESDTDDAEVEEAVTVVRTCCYCKQKVSAQNYSSHKCSKRKKTTGPRKGTGEKGHRGTLVKPRKAAKLGQHKKHKGSLTLTINKMTPKNEQSERSKLKKAALTAEAGANSENVIITEPGTCQGQRQIRGSRKRKSGVVRKKVKSVLYPCEICDMVFSSQDKLQWHSYSHTGEKPFVCPHEDCGKAFVSKFKLKRHVTTHGEGQIFPCAYCDKTFRRKDHLKNHLKVHDPNKTVHRCSSCQKEYASMFAFRTHIAFHKAEQGELKCYVCSKVLPSKEEIFHHLKVHSGARSVKDPNAKKHKCKSCGKTFFTAKDVRRHAVVHTKERQHMCHLCPQRFGRKDHLVRHIRLAHNKNPLDPLNIENPALSILPPAVKLAKESKKQVKKRQKGLSVKKKSNATTPEVTLGVQSSSVSSLQSQPTVILSDNTKETNQPRSKETKSEYVVVDCPTEQPNAFSIRQSYKTAEQQEIVPVSDVPLLQQVATIPNPTTQSSDVQTYLELQPSEYFQFVISQNSNINLPKTQQIVNQVPDQTPARNQTLTIQPSLSKSKTQRKPRRQRTKTKSKPSEANLLGSQISIQPEAYQQVNSQQPGYITLPNVQNLLNFENHPSVATLTAPSSFNLDNISFSGLTSIKPKGQVQGQINTSNIESQGNNSQLQISNVSGPVFPQSAVPGNSQPSNVMEVGNVPLAFLSVNSNSVGLTEQFQLYQFVAPTEQNSNQITEKSAVAIVSQQQQLNQPQPVFSGYNETIPVPNTQVEGSYPHEIVSHDSEAVKVFFPEEQKTVM